MVTSLLICALTSGTVILDQSYPPDATRHGYLTWSLVLDYDHLQRETVNLVTHPEVSGAVEMDGYNFRWDEPIQYRFAAGSEQKTFPIWDGSDWQQGRFSLEMSNPARFQVDPYATRLVPLLPGDSHHYPFDHIEPTFSGDPIQLDWTLAGLESTRSGTVTVQPLFDDRWGWTYIFDRGNDNWQWLARTNLSFVEQPIVFHDLVDGQEMRLQLLGVLSATIIPEPSAATLCLLAVGILLIARGASATARL